MSKISEMLERFSLTLDAAKRIKMLERTGIALVALEQGGNTGDFQMSYKSPWHSKKPNTPNVYHNNDKCTEGNNIESYYLAQGTDGRPLCKHCERLNKEGK